MLDYNTTWLFLFILYIFVQNKSNFLLKPSRIHNNMQIFLTCDKNNNVYKILHTISQYTKIVLSNQIINELK